MNILIATLLGIVEGITEFLPISSTAHLIIAGDVLGWRGDIAKTFEIFIQLGAILAILWLYRRRCIRLVQCLWSAQERPLAITIFISFLPAAITGFLLHSYIKRYLFSPILVGVTLALGGLAILAIEARVRTTDIEGIDHISFRKALGIGLAQCLALIPGVSRSGATIMGGLALGLPRGTATEFSFFLAIPTMFAATLYDLAKNIKMIGAHEVPVFAVGFLSAFLSALIVIKIFIRFVQKHRFIGFAWYRIGVGALILFYYICRI